MKRHMYWLLFGIAILFTFSACIRIPESNVAVSKTPSVINSVVNSAETTIDFIEQYDVRKLKDILLKYTKDGIYKILAIYEYPSPDKTRKLIEVNANEGDADYWAADRKYLFLNDFNNLFYVYDDNFQESLGAVWINNETVAIAAEFIVNLKTGERKDMGKPVANTKYWGMKEMPLRSGLYIEELDSLIYIDDYDMTFYLFLYSLKDGTWIELAQRPFETEHVINNYIHFKRENENEVSFNTEKKQRLSFNFYTKEFREIPYVGEYYGP